MSNTPQDFLHEFPEYKDQVHRLKTANQHFARLFGEYHDCNHALHRIEQAIETPSDEHTENLKKKRLHLKDQLVTMIQAA